MLLACAQIRRAHRQAVPNDFWITMQRPKTRRTVFQPNAEKILRKQQEKQNQEKPEPVIAKGTVNKTGIRLNPLNIQMLPKNLHELIFKNTPPVIYESKLIDSCRKTLEKHGMCGETDLHPEIDLKLPALEGENLKEHFYNIAREQSEPYLELLRKLSAEIPIKPKKWLFRAGWTRYTNNAPPQEVEYPLEHELVFDVEVCMAAGKAPTLAAAVSSEAWYGWVSQSVIDGSTKPVTNHEYHEDALIPIEGQNTKPKIIVGHNVSFDRAKIREQYCLKQTAARFVDTMSLHVCISGLTSYQRAALKSKKENPDDDAWKGLSSLNSLSEVHKLYCGSSIDKATRDLFVEGNLADIQREFQTVMDYCCEDVSATHRVFCKLYPLFNERFPHPVTFAGMLELGTAYLPVNDNWSRYIEECDQTYEELESEGKVLLAKRADQACQLLHDDKFKQDIWMWDQDWSVKNLKVKKTIKKAPALQKALHEEEEIDELDEKFAYLQENSTSKCFLSGYPNWYRKLCVNSNAIEDWTPGPHLISTGMQITPKLLNLCWEGYPLHYIRGLGWGLLVPFSSDWEEKELPLKQLLEKCPLPVIKSGGSYSPNIRQEVQDNLARKEYYSRLKKDKTNGVYNGTGIWCNTILEDSVFFFKLPHKDGTTHRVGNPLAKDFLNKFSENVLSGDTECAEQVLTIARQLSYWRNNRDRIKGQMIVWTEQNKGAILPQVVVCGTLTRRAVEPTWMTASNAHKERIGSELRSMIQAPAGYKIVGADVDSQELWIASVIGDAAHAKMHGATPLGWMTLSGTKSDATDMHSVTAKAVGISRDHAKVINYARIYGAGQNFAERLLKQFNPTMTEAEARSKAQKMFSLTKGKRFYHLKREFVHDLSDVPYHKWQAYEIAKLHGKHLEDMFEKPFWIDGTESAMFNQLEKIAGNLNPVTPFLECRLSRALEPEKFPDDRFLPTRINWVVQSGAVDFLHLMLVCMRWLMKDKARFCLSFHDEVRYLVEDKDKYHAALAMHVTNLLTRAFCSQKLGINDLPESVAFFSSVEIDQVLRKESKQDCKTPSNPHGLQKGYGIPDGESLNIREAIKKAHGDKEWYLEIKCRGQPNAST